MLLKWLARHAAERPGQIAIRSLHEEQTLAFGALWTASRLRAATLRLAGLREGEVVLIFAPQGLSAVVTWLATMIAGGVPSLMPLPSERQDTAHYWQQHAVLFAHIGSGMAVMPAAYQETPRAILAGMAWRLMALEALADGAAPIDPTFEDVERIALLQHSSGTTGLKKGVALTYSQLEVQVQAYAHSLNIGEGDRIVSWLPIYHDMGLIACLVLPLTLGLEVTCLDPFRWAAKPQLLFDAITKHRATHAWMPNFGFMHLVRAVRADLRKWDLSSMKAFVNCSEPCRPSAFDAFFDRWREHGVTRGMLTCCYATAESVFAISQTRPGQETARISLAAESLGILGQPAHHSAPGEQAAEFLSSGRPLHNVQLHLCDESGAAVPDGCYGAIYIAAPFLFSGYYKDPERTAIALAGEWYRTGDIGVMLDGELYVCGRLDDMFIVNGRNLYAHEIERICDCIPGVVAGRVVAFPSFVEAIGSNQLVIVAESLLAEERAREALRVAIGNEVMTAVGVLPSDVRIVPRRTVIKTTSGKIDRKSNMRRYSEGRLVGWGQLTKPNEAKS